MSTSSIAPEWLFDDLDVAQKRRLYLLLFAIQHSGEPPSDTIFASVRKLLNFVMVPETLEQAVAALGPDAAGEEPLAKLLPDQDEPRRTMGLDPVHFAGTARAPRVLLPDQRKEFEKDIAAGRSNQQLAAKFGLSVRQAHGLRIGYARAHAKSAKSVAEAENGTDSEPAGLAASIALSPIGSLDEVVRFLRQCDDIVVRKDDGYLVNGRFYMGPVELIERANRKRRQSGKKLFEVPVDRPFGVDARDLISVAS